MFLIVTLLRGEGWLVKTGDPEGLEDFASIHDFTLTPLITYPGASPGVVARFSCWYVVESDVSFPQDEEVLGALPGVECVERNAVHYVEFPEPSPYESPIPQDTFYHPYLPNDPLFSDQWDKKITQTDWAWNVATGEGVVIGIVDSGADTDHEDLEVNLVAGYNFVDDTTDAEDKHGHGTHVSGIAAAVMDNAKGIAGIAPGASIMPLKVSASGQYTDADLAEAIIYACDHGADVVNMSLGSELPSSVVEDAVEYAWGEGLVLCATAGNDGEDTPVYPAAYEHVISVGATTPGDSRWSLSNYGPSVNVFAPGAGLDGVLSTRRGGSYEWRSGTSMAAPQVAGLAALVISAYPEYTNLEVRDRIIQTADTIPVSHDPRINSRAALGVVDIAEDKAQDAVSCSPAVQAGTMRFQVGSTTPSAYTLRIFDAAGRKVAAAKGRTDGSGIVELRPGLGTGVYFWKVSTDAGTGAGKIVFLNP